MSRGISYEEVEFQAENLLVKGQNPTLEKVRRGLGDRGSHTTLSKYLNEWRRNRIVSTQSDPQPKSQSQSLAHSQLGPVPLIKAVLPDPVNAAVSRVWQHLQEESKALLQSTQEESLKTIELLKTEKEEIALQHLQTTKALETLEHDLKNSKIENTKLEKALLAVQKDLELAVSRLQDFERSYANFKVEQQDEKNKLLLALTEARERIAQLEERHRQFKFIEEFLEEQSLS